MELIKIKTFAAISAGALAAAIGYYGLNFDGDMLNRIVAIVIIYITVHVAIDLAKEVKNDA